ncbi:MAG TPA: MFS transporter [Candidatus Dormibacteraeota bacterium]|nr:MFS transporter [Candidatus Dormibacteraeota bacterium]
MSPTSRWAPLAVPGFRSLWLAGVLSWYGDFLTLPALLIIGYRIGGEAAVGLVVAVQAIPLLVLLPFGGQLGDRGDRRRRLVALDLVRAALAALIVVGAHSELLAVVVLGVGASRTAGALYDPGRRRLVSVVLPERLVPAGGSLLSVISESSILVAPAIGAGLLVVVTPTFLVVIDGCTFLLSAALMARVGPQPAVWRDRSQKVADGWRSLRRGFDLLLLDRTIGLFAIQAGLGAMVAGVITVYFVPLVHSGLHLGTDQVGVMYVIVGGASVLGSMLALQRPQVGRRGLIVVGYLHLVVAVLVGVLLGPAVVVVALVVFAATGALQEVWGLNRLQTTTPRDGIGQAFGAALWFQYLGRAVGAVVGAWGATHLPQARVFELMVVAALVTCFVASLSRASVWRRRSINWPPGGPPLPLEP